MIVDEARASEIDYLYFATGIALHEDIFRFEIAMNEVQTMNVVKTDQNLVGYFLQSSNRKIRGLLIFPVVFIKFIKVIL
jgi:hypothetical protein